MFEHAPCGLLVTEPDGRILTVNATLLGMTGYDRAALEGARRFDELLTPGGRIFHETHLRPLLELQGHLREIAVELVRADGGRLPALLNAVVARDPDGAASYVQIVLMDATERHSYERELVVASRRIERLQRVTAAFAAILDAHGVAREALGELVDGVKADYGALALVGHAFDELEAVDVVAASPELAGGWQRLPLDEATALGRALRAGAPIFLEGGDGREEGLPPLARSQVPATRLAVLPLVVEGRSIGVLCLASCTQSAFPEDERLFLVSFARLCAQALERGRLHEATALAARRAGFLSELSHALEEAVGFAERAQTLVDLLVPEIADFATVEIPARGARPVAASHRDPELLVPLLDLRERANVGADKPHSMARARATGEAQLLVDIPEELYEVYDQDEQQLALLRRLAPRSYVGLPLNARGELVGSLMLVMTTSGRRFSPADLQFYGAVADRVGVALENARLYEHERDVAHRLQVSLLPTSLPEDARVRTCARYRPGVVAMEIGGDWYDAFLLPGDRLGFVVGDVVGHQMDAAIVMGQLRTALRAFALDGAGPGSAVARLSRFSLSVPDALCTTVVYAELELATQTLRWSSAGHLPPIVLSPALAPCALWDGRTPPLGATPDAPPAEATVVLADGASVVLVTDGLIERRDAPLDECIQDLLARLAAYGTTPFEEFADDLISALLEKTPQTDDVCVLAVSLQPTTVGEVVESVRASVVPVRHGAAQSALAVVTA